MNFGFVADLLDQSSADHLQQAMRRETEKNAILKRQVWLTHVFSRMAVLLLAVGASGSTVIAIRLPYSARVLRDGFAAAY